MFAASAAVSRRVVSTAFKRQAVRSFSKKYPHKPREEAFFPGLVSRYNVEDQNVFLAIIGYGTLIFLGVRALSGEKPAVEESKSTSEGIPSIVDDAWPEWIAENNGANVEAFFNNLAE